MGKGGSRRESLQKLLFVTLGRDLNLNLHARVRQVEAIRFFDMAVRVRGALRSYECADALAGDTRGAGAVRCRLR